MIHVFVILNVEQLSELSAFYKVCCLLMNLFLPIRDNCIVYAGCENFDIE